MIHDLKPYPAMKDSGVPWLGQVPEHWEVTASKWLFKASKELARPDDVQLSATQAYGVIAQDEYERRSGSRVVKISMHLDKRKHVEKNDFVISMRSFQGGLERAWTSGAIRSSYVVLKPQPEADVEFYSYLLKSHDYIRALQATGGFIRDGQDLTEGNFRQVALPLPPLDEQRAMGNFLAYADRRIRKAIAAKQKLIKLLQEQKQVIIHQGVTRGLDPNVKLKPSGVEWLGDIPEGWEVKRLKELITPLKQGWSPQCDAQPAGEGEWGVVKVGCVNSGEFNSAQNKRLPETLQPIPELEIVEGDILVSRANTRELVGLAALTINPRPKLILCDKLFRFRAKSQLNSHFAVLAIRGTSSRAQIESSTSGASDSMQNIGQSVIRNLFISLPSEEEQQAIVTWVQTETEKLNQTISRALQEIALLREYRTRLIADVVTGKLDVRDAAARLPELTDEVVPVELDDVEDAETEELDTDGAED